MVHDEQVGTLGPAPGTRKEASTGPIVTAETRRAMHHVRREVVRPDCALSLGNREFAAITSLRGPNPYCDPRRQDPFGSTVETVR